MDWHFDHVNALPNQPAFAKGFVYVMLRLTVGEVSFTIDMQLYLLKTTMDYPVLWSRFRKVQCLHKDADLDKQFA